MGAALAFALVGGGESGGSILRWDEDPTTAHPPGLPNDRIVFGAVRNTTLRRIDALATDFEVRDANGRKLEATVRFMGSFAHGL